MHLFITFTDELKFRDLAVWASIDYLINANLAIAQGVKGSVTYWCEMEGAGKSTYGANNNTGFSHTGGYGRGYYRANKMK